MTKFLTLLSESQKSSCLGELCHVVREGRVDTRSYDVDANNFRSIPGSPFAYWISKRIRGLFERDLAFSGGKRLTSLGASTKDDFRFTRSWVEVKPNKIANQRAETKSQKWVRFIKGGTSRPIYQDPFLVINWLSDGLELKANISEYRGARGWGYQWSAALNGHDYYFREGLTWPLRGRRFSTQIVSPGSIFSVAGKMAFVPREQIFCWAAILNSDAFSYLIRTSAGSHSGIQFEAGLVGRVPVPNDLPKEIVANLNEITARLWRIRCKADSISETSNRFVLPLKIRPLHLSFDLEDIIFEERSIISKINDVCFDLYEFDENDRMAATGILETTGLASGQLNEKSEDEGDQALAKAPIRSDELSWAAGIAFGRFDWRLATGEREFPPEPDPFDPLPAKSPGMLPDGAEPFHAHSGILVDDRGHPHDLPRLIEEVLTRVDAEAPGGVRRWLQRDFFPFHLKQYSKSRRRAPIYWPISTNAGSYTLWLYYPDLTSQTLYTAVNDFVEPKLKEARRDLATLRDKGGSRSSADEKALEKLQDLELELIELRDALLEIAPTYRPNHDDGVQITAAPLWQLFRHKPWQKVLQDTWTKLEKGDYDWAHLAMAYWPGRVREKCKTDKSLAIAHDLEHLYVEPEDRA